MGGNGADEQQLIAAARSRDADAWRTIITRYRRDLVALATSLLGDPTEAEDVAQEAFIRGLTHLKSFRRQASLRTWLSRIAVNLCRTRHRRRARARRHEAEPRPLAAPAPDESAAVRAAVAALPPELREAVVLRYFLGYSGREMAESLGCKESTAWSRVYAGLERLRRDFVCTGEGERNGP